MSYTLSAQMIGTEEMKEVFSKVGDVFHKEFGSALEESGKTVERYAKSYAPVKTGSLAGSIVSDKPIFLQDNVEVHVGTNIKYARAQEYGTVGMMINVRNGRRTKNGRTRPYTYVGNTRAKLYFKEGRDSSVNQHEKNVKRALDNIMAFLSDKK